MTEKNKTSITLQIKFKDTEQTFTGNAEDAWLFLCKLFKEFLPSFDVASKLWLNIDLQSLANECSGLIAFSPEGANLTVKGKLTDNETLSLWLLASYLGHALGMLETDSLSKEELQVKLGKSGKITSTRLGELAKNGIVTKLDNERFKITTFGAAQMQKETLSKIKTKTSA